MYVCETADLGGDIVVIVIVICVHQGGCSLSHSARTPPAVHQGMTIWVDEIEFEKK